MKIITTTCGNYNIAIDAKSLLLISSDSDVIIRKRNDNNVVNFHIISDKFPKSQTLMQYLFNSDLPPGKYRSSTLKRISHTIKIDSNDDFYYDFRIANFRHAVYKELVTTQTPINKPFKSLNQLYTAIEEISIQEYISVDDIIKILQLKNLSMIDVKNEKENIDIQNGLIEKALVSIKQSNQKIDKFNLR